MGSEKQRRLMVNLQACKFDVVRQSASQLGYDEVEEQEENWDLCWSDLSVSIERVAKLRPWQRLNHFPSMLEICRKGALSLHMRRMAVKLPDEYCFYPLSLNLPAQLEELVLQLRKNEAKLAQGTGAVQTFILKPTHGSQGRGIHLVQTCAQLKSIDISNVIAQAYVSNPLLLDGFKFDMRIYALVLSVDPLKIYLYDEGLARLATVPYAPPSSSNIHLNTLHLTNYSVNKNSASFVGENGRPGSSYGGAAQTAAAAAVAAVAAGTGIGGGGQQGTKRPVSTVLHQVAMQRGCSHAQLVESISDIVVKTVMAIQPLLSHTYHTAVSSGNRDAPAQCAACPCVSLDHWSSEGCECSCPPSQCFELLGFDIIFDTDLRPWLLEVNHSPSLACDALIDQQVKSALISDTLSALDQRPEHRLAFFEHQQRATSERLYSQATRPRPLTCLPKNKQLHAAYQALEDLTARIATYSSTSSSSLSVRLGSRSGSPSGSPHARDGEEGAFATPSPPTHATASSTPSHSTSASPGKTVFVSTHAHDRSTLGPGMILQSGSQPGSIGRFAQIYPPPLLPADGQLTQQQEQQKQRRSRLLRIMASASDVFPDQRCTCSYCVRRLRARHLASTTREISAAASLKPRPLSACCTPTSASACTSTSGNTSTAASATTSRSASLQRPSAATAAAEVSPLRQTYSAPVGTSRMARSSLPLEPTTAHHPHEQQQQQESHRSSATADAQAAALGVTKAPPSSGNNALHQHLLGRPPRPNSHRPPHAFSSPALDGAVAEQSGVGFLGRGIQDDRGRDWDGGSNAAKSEEGRGNKGAAPSVRPASAIVGVREGAGQKAAAMAAWAARGAGGEEPAGGHSILRTRPRASSTGSLTTPSRGGSVNDHTHAVAEDSGSDGTSAAEAHTAHSLRSFPSYRHVEIAVDKKMERYLRVLYPGRPKSQRQQRYGHSQLGQQQGAEGAGEREDGAGAAGTGATPTASSPSFVPRVALLSTASSRRGRHGGQDAALLDPELVLLRMRTSNLGHCHVGAGRASSARGLGTRSSSAIV